MNPRRPSAALYRLAQSALAVACAVFAWSVVMTVRTTPTASESETASSDRLSPRIETGTLASATDADIERTVAHDLFSASRSAPASRYARTASEADASPSLDDPVTEPAEPPLLPTVQGTAVGATGDGFAMCAIPGESAKVVRVGDVVGEYTVVRIERERVTFRDTAGRRHIVAANASSPGEDR